jgi:hypothetical protein
MSFLCGVLASAVALAAAEPLPSVAVDLTGLDAAEYAKLDGLALEKRLVLRLVQDGFAVVAPAAPADVRVTVSAAPGGLLLVASGGGKTARREVPIAEGALAELHLELAQKVAELARSCVPAPKPALPPPPPVAPSPPPAEAPFRVAASGGAVVRAGGTDFAGRLAVRYGRLVGVHVVAGLVPSFGDGLWVLEGQLLVGPSVKVELAPGAELEAALAVGAALQFFQLADAAALERTGARLDLAAALPISFTYWPARSFGLGVRVTPGLASQGRQHSSGGQVLWTRGAASFEAGVLLAARF